MKKNYLAILNQDHYIKALQYLDKRHFKIDIEHSININSPDRRIHSEIKFKRFLSANGIDFNSLIFITYIKNDENLLIIQNHRNIGIEDFNFCKSYNQLVDFKTIEIEPKTTTLKLDNFSIKFGQSEIKVKNLEIELINLFDKKNEQFAEFINSLQNLKN